MKITDADIRDWMERHDLTGSMNLTDARAAMEDAQSIDLIRPAESVAQGGCACKFDAWQENPYTKVLMKSISEDYVPRHDPTPATGSDWPEDFSHENGNYENTCSQCGKAFIGHKRRVICKACTATGSGGEAAS